MRHEDEDGQSVPFIGKAMKMHQRFVYQHAQGEDFKYLG